MSSKPKIAVIGAGIAGLYLARSLRARAEVTVFEKSRGMGGRMSTRRASEYQFDHGAQYFTAPTPEFRAFLDPFISNGVVAEWRPRLARIGAGVPPVWTAPRYVAVPGMNALAKAMAEGVQVHRARRVAQITGQPSAWELTDVEGQSRGVFDWVVSTAPAEQSALVMPIAFSHAQRLADTRIQACYTLMLGIPEPLDLAWDAAVVTEAPLAWIAQNQTKPGRSSATSLVVQSDNDWAHAHIEADQDWVAQTLTTATEAVVGRSVQQAEYVSLHRWRYANVKSPAEAACLFDPENQLAACGDWCQSGRVEAAFSSAQSLCEGLKRVL